MTSMSEPPEQEGSEGDMDHGVRDIDPLFIVAHEAAPAHHPAEGALDNPTAREDVEALLAFDAADDLETNSRKAALSINWARS